MEDLVSRTKLRRAYGRIRAILDQEGVELKTFHTLPDIYLTVIAGVSISLNELALLQPYDDNEPPRDWDDFLAAATDMFVKKNTDYGNSFMKALIGARDPQYFWAWEATKKLNRLRTWLKRGELKVFGEKVKDDVLDLFVYTVQFFIFIRYEFDPFSHLNERGFYARAAHRTILEWLDVYANLGVIKPDEEGELIELLLTYMGRGK